MMIGDGLGSRLSACTLPSVIHDKDKKMDMYMYMWILVSPSLMRL